MLDQDVVKIEITASLSFFSGAPFVLYNYTRLHAILERYNDGVSKGIYPQMPSVHDINYNLLSSEVTYLSLLNWYY